MTRRIFLSAAAATAGLHAAGPRTAMGIATTSFGARRLRDPYQFLELCGSLGAGGIQCGIRSSGPAELKKLRDRAGQLGMYIEVMGGLPRSEDTSAFEASVRAAKQVGALCIRTACLSGRRYETFSTLAEWKEFVAVSKAAIARAVPIVEKHKLPMAIENHKDWTLEEHVALLKEYESPRVGACIDTGNNISLLDDPMQFVEALAPYAVTTHMKDMAVEEYEDGFLLAEVPLGQGILDMKRIAAAVSKARPAAKFVLEMITRNPLEIPCLTGAYWVTFPERSGRHLARTLAMVRANKPPRPLPRIDHLDRPAQLRLEEDNVKQCLSYAAEAMGL